MKVYLVYVYVYLGDEESETHMCGVFDSKEKAEVAISLIKKSTIWVDNEYWIVEHEINELDKYAMECLCL